jgi:hypothetical protein
MKIFSGDSVSTEAVKKAENLCRNWQMDIMDEDSIILETVPEIAGVTGACLLLGSSNTFRYIQLQLFHAGQATSQGYATNLRKNAECC